MMKTIYYVFSEEYEADAFYDENEVLITMWSCNDANWRSEYMDTLLEALGYNIVYREDLVPILDAHCKKLWG